LSDLAKVLMTRSIARPLYNNWAFCSVITLSYKLKKHSRPITVPHQLSSAR